MYPFGSKDCLNRIKKIPNRKVNEDEKLLMRIFEKIAVYNGKFEMDSVISKRRIAIIPKNM